MKNHQGYVDASTTSTNVLQFYLTDAEERAHNYTSNEDIAKGAASSELRYFNFVSRLLGTTTVDSNANSYRDVGIGSDGTLTQAQLDWNKQQRISGNALLDKNTQRARQVDQEDMAYKNGVFSRDLAGFPLGTHDGLTIYNKSRKYIESVLNSVEGASEYFQIQYFGRKLGYGIITGASLGNDDNLTVVYNGNSNLDQSNSDLEAIWEYTGIRKTAVWKTDWSSEFTEIQYNNGKTEFENDANMLKLILTSIQTLENEPQAYNAFRNNCIIWARSLCKQNGGTNCHINHNGVRPGQ